jgi:hypothetical protein
MLEKQLGEVLFSAEAKARDQVLAHLKEQLDACETSMAQERADCSREVQVKNEALREAADKLQEMAAQLQSVQVELAAKCDRHGEEVAGILERSHAERAALVVGFEEEKAGLERQLDQALFDPAKASLGQESLHLREKLRSCEMEMEEAAAERARQKEEERELLSVARGDAEQLRSTVSSLEQQLWAAHSQHAEQCDRHIQELGEILETNHAERAELVAAFGEEKAGLEKQVGGRESSLLTTYWSESNLSS